MKKGMLTADKTALDATTDIFDLRRLRDYFVRVLGDHAPGDIADTGIMLTIFSNRLEIVSPGNLPHMLTPGEIASGARYTRNQTLVNVMRDYGYVDPNGMG